MANQTSFTFIYATGNGYVSVESDVAKKELKVGCLGMGPVWGLSDHTWDYVLTPEIQSALDKLESDCAFSTWDECYFAEYEPDLQWEVIIAYDDGAKKRSFGEGMKSENFDILVSGAKSLVTDLSKDIYIDLEPLEAVYFCHVANGIYCATTLYRDLESKFEKTGLGEMSFTLTSEQWGLLAGLINEPGLPKFGYCKEDGTQFVSRALYLGGKMVSYTYGGIVGVKWEEFEKNLLSIIL